MKAVKATLLLTHITFAPMCENRSGHTFYAKRTTHGQTHTLMPECCITDKEWGINRGWRQRQRRKFAVSRITSKHLIMASTHGCHDWLRRGRGATSEGVMPSSLKWRGKDGSTQRAAVFQLHNNKATGDVTLARRTYGKRVVLERWQTSKCDLEMSVKGRIDGNDTWGVIQVLSRLCTMSGLPAFCENKNANLQIVKRWPIDLQLLYPSITPSSIAIQ